jgi:hypothetical protein
MDHRREVYGTYYITNDVASRAEAGYLSKTTVFIPGVAPPFILLCTVFSCLVDRFYLGIVLSVRL